MQLTVLLALTLPAQAPAAPLVKPRSVQKVYADGRHNMNTAFTRFKDFYWLSFRTGTNHRSDDGDTLVFRSADGDRWEQVRRIDTGFDDRDVQFVATPKRLFLYIPSVERPKGAGIKLTMFVTHTDDGARWSELQALDLPQQCLWRPFLHEGRFWATTYKPLPYGQRELYLVRSDDGIRWEKVADMRKGHGETETTLQFVKGGKLLAFHRDNRRRAGFVMASPPPYTDWSAVRDAPVHFAGHFACTYDGVHYLLSRTLTGSGQDEVVGTMIYTFDDDGHLTPYCELPASKDCAYPNVVRVGDAMWVSYHSQHEGPASIYLAKVPLRGK